MPERKPVNTVISSVAPALARQNLKKFAVEKNPVWAREKSIINENIGVTDFSLSAVVAKATMAKSAWSK